MGLGVWQGVGGVGGVHSSFDKLRMNGGDKIGVNGGRVQDERGSLRKPGDAPTLTLPLRGRGFIAYGEGIYWLLWDGILGFIG